MPVSVFGTTGQAFDLLGVGDITNDGQSLGTQTDAFGLGFFEGIRIAAAKDDARTLFGKLEETWRGRCR